MGAFFLTNNGGGCKIYINGLTNSDAASRLQKYGKNELPKQAKESVFTIFFRELKDPIVLVLIVSVIFCFIIILSFYNY